MTEAQSYAAFVDATLRQLQAGLALDHTDKKRRIGTTLENSVLTQTTKPAAQRVLEGRFALGADDAAYLQTGLATLWSTAPEADATDKDAQTGLALAPPGLYTPDAAGGIRAGLVRALKARAGAMRRSAPADLAALAPALRLLLGVETLRTAVKDGGDVAEAELKALLDYKWDGDETDRKAMGKRLLRVLRVLLSVLNAKGSKSIATLVMEAVEEQAKKLDAVETTAVERAMVIRAVKARLEKANGDLEYTKKRLVTVTRQRDQKAEQLKAREEQLREAQANEAVLEEQLLQMGTQKQELEASAASLREALQTAGADSEAERTNLVSQLTEKTAALEACTREKEELEEQLREANALVRAKARALEDEQAALLAAKQNDVLLEGKLKALTDKAKELEAKLEANEKDLVFSKQRAAVLDGMTKALNRDALELEAELEASEEQLREARANEAALQEQLQQMGAKKQELEASVASLREALQTAGAASVAERARLDDQLAEKTTELDDCTREKVVLEVRLQGAQTKLTEENARYEAMTKIHEQEMVLLQEENKNLQGFALNERASMKERIDEIARRSETLDGLVDADKLTVFEAVMKLEYELKRVTQELDAQNAELAAQKLRRQRLRQRVNQRRGAPADAEDALEGGIETLRTRYPSRFNAAVAAFLGALSLAGLVAWATSGADPDGLQAAAEANEPTGWASYLASGGQGVARALAQVAESLNASGVPEAPLAVTQAPLDDDVDLSDWVVARGLVGQRGPACAAAADDGDATDARLAYDLPSPEALGALLPHLKRLLLANDDDDAPTDAQVEAALATLPPSQSSSSSASAIAEALAAFKGDYAVVGTGDAVHADDARGGVEVPHAVRWMPTTGARGRAAARVAALEHVVARCAKLAAAPSTSAGAKAALRQAAAALKVEQMAPLYAVREAVVYGEPEGTGCWHTTPSDADTHFLVTRPCAVVRGSLAFPVDAGIARVAATQRLAPTGADADAEAARVKTAKLAAHADTLQVRAQARARGGATNVYVAPPAHALKFAANNAATGVALGEALDVSEDVSPEDFTSALWLRIVRRAVVAAGSLGAEGAGASTQVQGIIEAIDEEGEAETTPEKRRDALWNEFRRQAGISQDRLWVFVRLLSGAVGGDVNEVIVTADEATMRATKALQDQRVQVAKRVSDMQSKIVETLVGSMARDSKLTLDKNSANQLVVVDGEARKQLAELASGDSGRPFFEANVALRNLSAGDQATPKPKLSQLLAGLSQVGAQMQRSLESTLTQNGTASASLTELSLPSNCYFVSMRADATAAIRIAHERLNGELGMRGIQRRISLWELIEGGCSTLTTRFAEFCGHVLVQTRSATGISAMYVSAHSLHMNAIQARVALQCLTHAAAIYAISVSVPEWDAPELQDARAKVMDAGARITDTMIGTAMRQSLMGSASTSALSTHRHESGWEVVGLRTR